jgi:protease I
MMQLNNSAHAILPRDSGNEEFSANAPQLLMKPGKRALFIIPPSQFRDEEYFTPRSILEKVGVRVVVASTSRASARGMLGSIVTPDLSIHEVNVTDFDAILLVGGVGCSKFWHDATVHRLITSAGVSGRILGAICLAPVTLANAGLLEGKCATAYPSARGFLEWKGAIYTGKQVQTDGNIVTADGPEAAEEFAQMITKLMAGSRREMGNMSPC